MEKIETDPRKCTGCLICQLQCSFYNEKIFNPELSRIKIKKTAYDIEAIEFTEDCTECGVCARFCAYGALKLKRGVENG
ncbi:MAG: 4Fe-4S dicluster domain-containing protein [Candidatus Helarchaeota archaeon]